MKKRIQKTDDVKKYIDLLDSKNKADMKRLRSESNADIKRYIGIVVEEFQSRLQAAVEIITGQFTQFTQEIRADQRVLTATTDNHEIRITRLEL